MPEKNAAPAAFPQTPLAAEITFESFLQKWGDDCDFDEAVIRRIWDFAEDRHDDVPTHNFGRAKQAAWRSMEIANALDGEYALINRRVAVGAALLHTVAFGHPIKNSGHASREERAAYCAGKNAQQLGFKPTEFVALKRTIGALQSDKKIVFMGDAVLARASLDEAGGNYETVFLPWLNDLQAEARLLSDKENSVHDILAPTLAKVADPVVWPKAGLQDWSRAAIANIGSAFSDHAAKHGMTMAEYVHQIGTSATGKLFNISELGAALLPTTS